MQNLKSGHMLFDHPELDGRAYLRNLYMLGDDDEFHRITATSDELNALNLLSRKYEIYSAGALSKGALLHISSYDAVNDVFIVEKADADTSGKQAQLIASEDNAGAETSLAADIVELTDLNTNAGSVGDPVYLSTTAGSWTLTAPTGADQIQMIVGRIKVKSATVGKIVFNLVRPDLVKVGSSALQAASVLKTKLAGGFMKVALAAGTNTGENVTISDIAVGDELVSVLSFTTAASIASVADRASEYVVGAGVLTKSAGTDERNNRLVVMYLDLT